MKKLLVAMGALVALASSAFALDFNVEANFNAPMNFGSLNGGKSIKFEKNMLTKPNEIDKGEFKVFELGGQVGVDVMFTDLIGAGIDFGFNGSPNFLTTAYTKVGDKYVGQAFANYAAQEAAGLPEIPKEIKDKTKIGFFDFNMFVGAAIRPLNTEKLALVVTPGMDFDFITISSKFDGKKLDKLSQMNMGVGIDLRFDYKITDMFAINVGTFESIQFFGTQSHSVFKEGGFYPENKTYKHSYGMFNFKWAPRVGAAVYF